MLLLEISFDKFKRSLRNIKLLFVCWVFVIALSILSIGATVYLGLEVCEDWDLIWVILFLISLIVELFVL